MKNILILMLFMFSASNLKQTKPVQDTIKKPVELSKVVIDTSVYELPKESLLDPKIEEVKRLAQIAKSNEEKAKVIEQNAKVNRAKRQTDEAFKAFDKLPCKTD